VHDKEEALTAYVAGHAILLWTLVMEVNRPDRAVAYRPAKSFSVGTVSVSVLVAAYGVILIGAFVLGRFAVNRLLGLILLGRRGVEAVLERCVGAGADLSRDCVRLPGDSVAAHVVSILALTGRRLGIGGKWKR